MTVSKSVQLFSNHVEQAFKHYRDDNPATAVDFTCKLNYLYVHYYVFQMNIISRNRLRG